MKNTKMLWIALTGLSISLLTACGDDISDSASATATSVQVYHVTASATAAQPVNGARKPQGPPFRVD